MGFFKDAFKTLSKPTKFVFGGIKDGFEAVTGVKAAKINSAASQAVAKLNAETQETIAIDTNETQEDIANLQSNASQAVEELEGDAMNQLVVGVVAVLLIAIFGFVVLPRLFKKRS